MLELADIENELENHLQNLRQNFGPEVKYIHVQDKSKSKYKVEIPESAIKNIGTDFELVAGGRKGFKRYLTPEAKVSVTFKMLKGI